MSVGAAGVSGNGAVGRVERLDNRSTPCALGLLRVRDRIAELPLGTTLEVVTRDRFARFEVPMWVERAGLELVSLEQRGFWLFASTVFRIRKTSELSPRR